MTILLTVSIVIVALAWPCPPIVKTFARDASSNGGPGATREQARAFRVHAVPGQSAKCAWNDT